MPGAAFLLVLLLVLGPGCGGPVKDSQPGLSDQDLFWGTDQYDFAIVLGASGLECFWHMAHQGEQFYFNYMVRSTGMALIMERLWFFCDFFFVIGFQSITLVLPNIPYVPIAYQSDSTKIILKGKI